MTESTAEPRPEGRRRFSLRARLIALVLVIATAALVAVDVVIPLVTWSSLISAKDQTLTRVIASLPPRFTLSDLQRASTGNQLSGEIGWSQVTVAGLAEVVFDPPGYDGSNPAIGAHPPTTGPFTAADVGGGSANYRALASQIFAVPTRTPEGYIVAWVPLADAVATTRRLVLLEVLISIGLLVLVGAAAGLVVRRELRPLETMARAADEIAAGDLSRRVDPGAPGTEIGRLGTAFNGMVDGVSNLLAERAESERRMRQFVADASHELRTPVAAIRGYTDLYRAGALPEEVALDRAMDRMGFESRRMGALVEDLLTLTHTDAETAPPTERIDLASLLTGVVDDAAVIDRSRTWRLAGTAAHAVVLGDRLRLHQLFANLLANVRTHTPAGTTATVSVSVMGATAGQPATAASGKVSRAAAHGDTIAVAVSDNGPGVAPEHLPRLFDRFFRVDPSRSREHGGSGLGLSIAAAIVRTHRGRIAATATPGGGLTVTVALPAAPPETAQTAGVASPPATSSSSSSSSPPPSPSPPAVSAADAAPGRPGGARPGVAGERPAATPDAPVGLPRSGAPGR